MRHNDAHYNNSLVQICTQWNLDRNPFIYVSCLPEGTKLHCIAAVLPLLLLQCWHFGWKQLLSEPPATSSPNCPMTACWQALGGTWLPPHDSYVNGMLCGRLSKLLVGRWDQFLTATWGVHLQCGVSIPAWAHACLTWEGWAGNPIFAIYCASVCGQRKKGIQKYHSKT